MKELIINPVTLKKNGEEVPIHGITDASKVSDVQINGESILNEDGVADVPIASEYSNGNRLGLSKYYRGFGITINASGQPSIVRATQTDIDARTNQFYPITPYNLKYAVESVQNFNFGSDEEVTLVEESDLEHYVKDTDYATGAIGGVIKASNNFALDVTNGFLNAEVRTQTNYPRTSGNAFISKGTLENIKETLVKSVGDDIYAPKREMDLIADVVVSERMSRIEIATDTDGNPFELSAVEIIVIAQPTETTASLFVNLQHDNVSVVDMFSSNGLATQVRLTYLYAEYDNKNDRMRVFCISQPNNANGAITSITPEVASRGVSGTINKISLNGNTTNRFFEPNSTIKIYGVRA